MPFIIVCATINLDDNSGFSTIEICYNKCSLTMRIQYYWLLSKEFFF